MEPVVSIARVSTKKQLTGESISRQQADIRSDCKAKNQKIIKEFVIAETASVAEERTTFIDALDWVIRHKKEVKAVKIWKVDRFSRGGLHPYYELKACLSKVGVRLESATEHIDDTPSGEAMEGFLAVTSRLENRIRMERTHTAERDMTKDGYWCRGAPTGFKNVQIVAGTDDEGRSIKRPTLAPCDDKSTWELLAYGLRKQMTGVHTSAEIARELARKGFLVRGMIRKGKMVQKPLSAQTWNKICRSPVYGGLNKEKATKGKLIRAKWNGPITPEEWHLLQKVLNKGNEKQLVKRRRKYNPLVPLRRFLLCPKCGEPVRGYGSTGKAKNKKHFYYDCENAKCGFRVTPKDAHTLFIKFMNKIKPTGELLALFEAIVLDVWEREFEELSRESIEAANKVTALKKERIEIMEMMRQAKHNAALYKQWEEQFNQKSEEIEAATPVRNEKEVEEYKAEQVLRYCRHYLEHVSELWKKADVEDQNKLQKLALPQGIHYDVLEAKRTPKLSVVYEAIKDIQIAGDDVAGPRGIEPRFSG